jgi:hypothetical protein
MEPRQTREPARGYDTETYDEGRINYGGNGAPSADPNSETYRGYSTGYSKSKERSASDLMRELINEAGAWIRAEATLMRLETRESVGEARAAIVSMTVAAALVHAGVLALVACAVLVLSRVWPAWLAALVVGLVLTIAGAVTLSLGKERLKGKTFMPTRVRDSLRGTKDALYDAHNQTREKWQ